MATVASKLMTAEEFYDFVHRPENRDRHFDLAEGEVVEVSQPGERHGVMCSNASYILVGYTRHQKKGYVCSNDTGVILGRDPDTVRGPDVSLYLESRKFDELAVKYVEHLPSLIVEVRSPTNRWAAIVRRINRFFDKGVALAWLLDPEDQTVHVFFPNKHPEVLEGDEEVTGQGVLPDFRCKASDFFVTAG